MHTQRRSLRTKAKEPHYARCLRSPTKTATTLMDSVSPSQVSRMSLSVETSRIRACPCSKWHQHQSFETPRTGRHRHLERYNRMCFRVSRQKESSRSTRKNSSQISGTSPWDFAENLIAQAKFVMFSSLFQPMDVSKLLRGLRESPARSTCAPVAARIFRPGEAPRCFLLGSGAPRPGSRSRS